MEHEWDIPGWGLEDIALEAQINEEKQEEFVSRHIWLQADNTPVAIEDMSTSHIKNCIKMIYRKNGRWRNKYLPLLKNELIKRKYTTQ